MIANPLNSDKKDGGLLQTYGTGRRCIDHAKREGGKNDWLCDAGDQRFVESGGVL
jgi:hypothetical protein